MPHTPYCVESVITTLNLPPPDSVFTLDSAGTDRAAFEVPAGRAIILTGKDFTVKLTMQNGAVYELPFGSVPPMRIVMDLAGGGLRAVKVTAGKCAVWADIDSPQTDESFVPE